MSCIECQRAVAPIKSPLISIDQPLVNGKQYQLQAVRNSQFFSNVSEVIFGSFHSDPELLGKVLVRIAGDNQSDDLDLTRGKTEVLLAPGGDAEEFHRARSRHKVHGAFLPH
jgi:hypothetical protein